MIHAYKNNAAEIVGLHHFTGNVIFRTFHPICTKSTEEHRQDFQTKPNHQQNVFKQELESPGKQLNSLCKGCSETGEKGFFCVQ